MQHSFSYLFKRWLMLSNIKDSKDTILIAPGSILFFEGFIKEGPTYFRKEKIGDLKFDLICFFL